MKFKKITAFDENYPLNLLESEIENDLWIYGQLKPEDRMAVAIVGTRQMSKKGKKMAHDYSFYLAGQGVTVVSGLARGIDSVAHKAALEARGRTLAVLGSGYQHFYPPENKKLANEISKSGTVISPFEPDERPLGKNFLARNKIIAALSLVVLVIEGKRRSGTLSTAAAAISMNKDVFVTSGSPKPLNEAGEYLLKNGAQLVNSPMDIFDVLR